MKPSIGRSISNIMRYQRLVLDYYLEEYGLGSGQYDYLITIALNEGISQKGISEKLKVNKATTTKAIRKLEQLGYIKTIVSKEDKRVHHLYLTDEGKTLFPKIRKVLRDYTDLLSIGLNDEEFNQLIKSLNIVEENVKQLLVNLKEVKQNEKKCKSNRR